MTFIIPLGLLKRNPVLRIIRKTHTKTVRLNKRVPSSVRAIIVELKAGQQSRCAIPCNHISRDSLSELMASGSCALTTRKRLAVKFVTLAPNLVGNPGCSHQIALVGRIDKYPAGESPSGERAERLNTTVLFIHTAFSAVKPFAADDRQIEPPLPPFKNRKRRRRFKRPHGISPLTAGALAVGQIVAALFMLPMGIVAIPVGHGTVEFKRDSAEGALVADIGLP